MTRLNFEGNSLNRVVVTSIDSTISQLDTALQAFGSLSIPAGFPDTGTINRSRDDLNTTRTRLRTLRNWAIDSTADFRTVVMNTEQAATSLPLPEVKARVPVVK